MGVVADTRLSNDRDAAAECEDLLFKDVSVFLYRYCRVGVAANVKHGESGFCNLRGEVERIPIERKGFFFGSEVKVLFESFPFGRVSAPPPSASRPALEIENWCICIDAGNAIGMQCRPSVHVNTTSAEAFEHRLAG